MPLPAIDHFGIAMRDACDDVVLVMKINFYEFTYKLEKRDDFYWVEFRNVETEWTTNILVGYGVIRNGVGAVSALIMFYLAQRVLMNEALSRKDNQ